MTLPHPRSVLRLIALLCLIALAIALISQHVFHMRPCAWCVLQRLLLIGVAAFCLLASLPSGPTRAPIQRILSTLAALVSVGGIVAAWYQYRVAAHSFSCARTFADQMMSGLGLDAAVPWLFGIYASCMEARVTLLGVEYSLWGLALFILCALGTLWAAFSRQHD